MRTDSAAPHMFAAPAVPGHIENGDQLQHQRRAANDPDDYIRQRAYRAEGGKPHGELLARREDGAHLLIEPKAITRPSGSAKQQRQRKELRIAAAETCEQAHGYSPKHEDLILENYLYLEQPQRQRRGGSAGLPTGY